LKTSELRIGNLLRDKVTKTGLKVTRLTEQETVIHVIDRSKFPLPDGWEIEPMPVTEECLLKFGFSKEAEVDVPTYFKHYGSFVDDDYEGCFMIFMDVDDNFYMVVNGRKIILASAHRLQNLYFELTDEELKQHEQ
jgi:hypothetical protein